MTDLEAIDLRISRRSFKGQMPEEAMKQIKELVQQVNEQSGLAFRFLHHGATVFGGISKSYGLFSGVGSLLVLAGKNNDENLLERIGYYGERLVLEATKLGLGTCWVGGTFDKDRLGQALPPEEKLVAVIPIGPVKEKRSLSEGFIRGLMHRKSKQPQDLYTADGTPPAWFLQGVEAALKAPSAINRQPVRFTWKDEVVTAGVDGEPEHQLIDLGIAKLHFEIGAGGKFALGNGGTFTKNNQ